ncbi:hypothetical protein C5N92_06380 [Glaesserella australis]|uniref:Rhodanese domain-containing protein n=2 Tax=Pasteurellaceae TaxID=712 RepID=A0A328BYX7_9PAST|nr:MULTISPECIES: rhodanese family protein [Glaesserella]AUI67190.1 hypothetical protein CJD39_08355 [Glaesserella sp. 15-184]RAL18835.1 hypothetical protein C5N92_06380 [Glaesserella australis]
MNVISTISVEKVANLLKDGAILIDIRQVDEYRREHIEQAHLVPLDQLKSSGLPEQFAQTQTLIFHCKSGMRTKNATPLFEQFAQTGKQIFILEGGIDGWKKAGLSTRLDKKQPLELMRQVQIAAGSLTLLGVILGSTVSSGFYLLSAFVGAGLIFAGVTGFCGMARLLAKMPWNKGM